MKKYIILLLVLVLSISFVGCNQDTGPEENNVPENSDSQEPSDSEKSQDNTNDTEKNETEDEEANKKEQEFSLYFSDNQALNLVVEKRNISYKKGKEVEALINELKKGPKEENNIRTIPEEVKILDVNVNDKIAEVNISSENLNGGSTEETFLISSIVKTLVQLDSINKVQFYVDGEKKETLMGHIMATEPFTEAQVNEMVNLK